MKVKIDKNGKDLSKLLFVGLSGLLIYLNYKDYKTTIEAIEEHDAEELNPVVDYTLQKYGKVGFQVLKGITVSATLISRSNAALLMNCIITGAAVINNSLLLKREKEKSSSILILKKDI